MKQNYNNVLIMLIRNLEVNIKKIIFDKNRHIIILKYDTIFLLIK